MNLIEIINSSRDRKEAIDRLVLAGLSRQEAKVLTFGYAAGVRKVQP